MTIPVQPAISDAYTVTTEALCKASGLRRASLIRHRRAGNLGQPQKRPGVRGNFYTPGQQAKFLRRIGKANQLKTEEHNDE